MIIEESEKTSRLPCKRVFIQTMHVRDGHRIKKLSQETLRVFFFYTFQVYIWDSLNSKYISFASLKIEMSLQTYNKIYIKKKSALYKSAFPCNIDKVFTFLQLNETQQSSKTTASIQKTDC